MSEKDPQSPPPAASQEAQPLRRMPEQGLGDEPVPTNWVAKEDLAYCRPELAERIADLDASQVKYLAGKIGDALQESYWIAVGVVLDDYFKEEEEVE